MTHLIQPCDIMSFKNLKGRGQRIWRRTNGVNEGEKVERQLQEIHNPGKTYFLKLAACCIQKVNYQRDGYDLTYPKNDDYDRNGP